MKKSVDLKRTRMGERGFTLIEMAITMVGFTLVSLLLASIVTVGAVSHERVQTKQAAEESADSALDALSRFPAVWLTSGTFTLNSDNTINLTGTCQQATCDYVLTKDTDLPPEWKVSYGAGILWADSPPTGTTARFVRRWRAEPVDSSLNLLKITVVVLPNATSTEPLAVKSVISNTLPY